MTQQAFPVTFANDPGGNNPASQLDQNFAVCVRGPSPTVNGVVPYWDNLTGTSLNAGYPTTPVFGTIQTLVGVDVNNKLPAVDGSQLLNFPAGQIRGFLAGLTCSNDGTSPNTVLDVAAGVCADSTNAVMINLASAFTKSTGGVWTSGSGNNGMGVGLTIAANTQYHVFAIVVSGAADVYFDTSNSAANKPVGTTAFRRIWSFRTNASSQIVAFFQNGDYCFFTAFNEINTGTTSALALRTFVTMPTVAGIQALCSMAASCINGDTVSATVAPGANSALTRTAILLTNSNGGQVQVVADFLLPPTNASGQVNVGWSLTSAVNDIFQISIWGYIDTRGRFA